MVRGIARQIEAAISIVIFISFLLFLLGSYNYRVLKYNYITYDLSNKENFVKIFLKEIEKPYYLVYLDVEIPKFVNDLCNNLNNNILKKDFCERFPIYYPINLSFITNYTGVINGSNISFLHTNSGIYFYENFTNYENCTNKNYVLVEVYNPNNYDLKDYQIFITSPTIYGWLKEGKYLSVKNNNEYLDFCYFHDNFVCNRTSEGSYGIWVKVNISNNSKILLNISISNKNRAEDPEKVFVFYDHFVYENRKDLEKNWELENIDRAERISDTEWLFYSGSSPAGIELKDKSKLNVGSNMGLLVFYKIMNNDPDSLEEGPPILNLSLSCQKIIINYYEWNFLFCRNATTLEIKEEYGQFNIAIDFIIIKKQADIEPIVNVIEENTCKKEIVFVIGDYIKYDYSVFSDLNVTNTTTTIKNAYLSYIYTNKIELYLNNSLIFENLFLSKLDSNNVGKIKNRTLALEIEKNINASNIRKIIFSNSSWFIFNYEKVYNNLITTDDLFYWYSDGYLNFPGVCYKGVCSNEFYIYALRSTENFIESYTNGLLFLSDENYLLIFINNPMNLIYNNPKRIYGKAFFQEERDYNNYLIYMYPSEKVDINLIKDLSLGFSLPKIKIKSIEKVYAIPIEELEKYKDREDIKIVLQNIDMSFGKLEKYSYLEKIPIYIFVNNSLIKDYMIIYIK